MSDMVVSLRIRADGSAAATVMNGVRRDLAAVNQSAQTASRGLAGMASSLRNLAVGVGIAAILKQIGNAFLSATNDSQKLVKGLTAVTGSALAAKVEMTYVAEVANKLGISIADAGEAYLSLAASSKGTVLEGKATRDIFESVSLAMSKLGKSSADASGALLAIQQSISKGKVSAEELTQQLGERMPGATKAFADAIGVTTEKLVEMMSNGELTIDMWEKFAQQLNKIYNDGKQISGVTSAWEGFKNQIDLLMVALDDQTGLTHYLDMAIRKAGELAGATRTMVNGEGFRNFSSEADRFNALLEERIRLQSEFNAKALEVANLEARKGGWLDVIKSELPGAQEELRNLGVAWGEVEAKIKAIQEGKKKLEESATKAKDQSARVKTDGMDPKLADPKFDQDLAARLTLWIKKSAEEGIILGVTSGVRTATDRVNIFQEAIKKHGSIAEARKYAAQYYSKHEGGDAGDVKLMVYIDEADMRAKFKRAGEIAKELGLITPVKTESFNNPYENRVHVELDPSTTKQGMAKAEREAETLATKKLNEEKQRLNEIERETAALYEATRTPVEALNNEIERLNQLRAVNPKMGEDLYARGITQAQDDFVASMITMQNELERTQQPAQALEQMIASLSAAYQAGDLAMAPYVKAVNALQAAYEGAEQSGEKLKTAAERMQEAGKQMGDSMAQAFEDAVLGAGTLQDILQALLRDIARIIMQKSVTEPLGNWLGDFFGNLFKSGFAAGGVMTPAGPMPLLSYASGGIATSPQLALFGEGSMNEAYVPLPDGRNIPVVLKSDKGEPSPLKITVNNLPGQDSRISQDSGGGLTIETVRASLATDMHQGGVPWVGAMERRYGMSRGRV